MSSLTHNTDDGNATIEREPTEEELEALEANFRETGLNETSIGQLASVTHDLQELVSQSEGNDTDTDADTDS